MPSSDDDSWRASQWDDPDSFEHRQSEACRTSELMYGVTQLLTHLSRFPLSIASNRDIMMLTLRSSGPWSDFVDPALSRSGGTIGSTAVVLYECASHTITLRFIDRGWVPLRGLHVSDITDVILEHDLIKSLDEEVEYLEDEDGPVGESNWTVESDLDENDELVGIEHMDDSEIEEQAIRELGRQDLPAVSQSEIDVKQHGSLLESRIEALTWELESLQSENETLKTQINALSRHVRILETRLAKMNPPSM